MSDARKFPIVGIGASAGGIEALEGFFQGMPEKPGAAFVIVTHLNPDRDSYLAEIVQRYTALPVTVAASGMNVACDHVYVMPPNTLISIKDGKLDLKPRSGARETKPVDIFLSALAKDRGDVSVAVVLSGADGDGTLGTKAVKEAGGLTLAQVADGHGPRYPDMPDTAISAGFIDLAVPADAMGAKIAEFAVTAVQGFDRAVLGLQGDDAEASARQEIYTILRNQVGHDFEGYKAKTFLRRVHRRMQLAQIAKIGTYIEVLRDTPKEVQALFRDLLISVTDFFRDAGAFEKLKADVIPKLFEGRGADGTVRVWVPGCATGEEVFSIAILMREHAEQLSTVPRVQLFATDIDDAALSVARAARYPAELLANVSEDRKRFFLANGGSYVVAKEIRDMCIFSSHNVIRDPPFSRMDLISCRNLLIYFGATVQHQVIPIFHYSLRPGGFLFLGTSENVTQFSDLFAPVDKKFRIFRSRDDVATPQYPMSFAVPGLIGGARERGPRSEPNSAAALRHVVEAQVLERLAPPHVVVNLDGEVVYFSGRTGKYLEAPSGVPTRQILAIARKSLRLGLRTALRECVQTDKKIVRERIELSHDDGTAQHVTLSVEPIMERNRDNPLMLVAFQDDGGPHAGDNIKQGAIGDPSTLMETELRDTRERLQSQIEEYETALEELKSSNEELVSLNEELQSTNEELEASKEEMQSLNEELHTVNTELTVKVDALDQANSDLENLFESTPIATVFLDRDLVIRTFTPGVKRIINILPGDRGRPLTDLTTRFALPNLAADVKVVAARGEPVERRIADKSGVEILIRMNPYRNSREVLEGVVVTFVDIPQDGDVLRVE